MYSDRVLEIFKNPPHAGGLQGANGSGKYIDEKSGDQVKIYFKTDENDIITDARFKTFGSVATIVASSVFCSELIGRDVSKLADINESIVLDNIDLPNQKKGCVSFVLKAFENALANFYKEKEKEEKQPKVQEVKKNEVKKQNNPAVNSYIESVKEKNENNDDEKPKSKIKAAFDELFKAWED